MVWPNLLTILRPPEGEAGTIQAARNAMTYSFCIGDSWLGALCIARSYFRLLCFQTKLAISTSFGALPNFGERVHGLVGDFVDGFGILATVISLVTNLGIGALVLVSGICYLLPQIPDNSATLITAVLIMMFVATITTVVGIEKAWHGCRVLIYVCYMLYFYLYF